MGVARGGRAFVHVFADKAITGESGVTGAREAAVAVAASTIRGAGRGAAFVHVRATIAVACFWLLLSYHMTFKQILIKF